jgi:hypothetical protein
MVVHNFLVYLGATYPEVTGLEQLRRDPHILGWMAYLRAQNPPLATTTCIGRFFALRTIFHELARTGHLAELAYLLLREDIPRSSVILYIACASSALWILCLPMDGFWRVPEAK